MTSNHETDSTERVTTASRVINAAPATVFELIADPARQPEWDGNDNLQRAEGGQRVRAVGDVFVMTLTNGKVRENHVVEFDEGTRIAWKPSEEGQPCPGHLWRWEVHETASGASEVTHTYDWTQLTDSRRIERARATTSERLMASIQRLAQVAETP